MSATNITTKVLFTIVAYNNLYEINRFMKQLGSVESSSTFEFELSIIDNFGNILHTDLEAVSYKVNFIEYERNYGYLGGCSRAFDKFLEINNMPDWLCICNSDLIIPMNLFQILKNAPPDSGLISPSIKNKNGKIQNPHLVERPSRSRMLFNLAVHRISYIGALYNFASHLKARFRIEFSASRRGSSICTGERKLIYSAHGSMFFLSRLYFEKGGEIKNSPFLFSEEMYIAEEISSLNLKCYCDEKVMVTHEEHSVSGFLSLRRKSKLMYTSHKNIFNKYYI